MIKIICRVKGTKNNYNVFRVHIKLNIIKFVQILNKKFLIIRKMKIIKI